MKEPDNETNLDGSPVVSSTDWLDALMKDWERMVYRWENYPSTWSEFARGQTHQLKWCIEKLRAEMESASNVRMSDGAK